MNNEKFTSVMAKAQQLMLDENFNRSVERKAAAFSGRGTGKDLNLMESQAFGAQQPRQVQMIQQPQQATIKGIDALPEYLRESFRDMPPIQGDISSVDPLSTLEQTLGIQQQRQIVSENLMPQVPQNVGGIDYSLIKTIVDESVKKSLAKMQKALVTENTGIKGLHIGAGNKIQFLDSKGNLYEGVLTLKKRAQTKE